MPLHFFANTYTGWLNATTGICSGFKYATASFQASKECLIMVGDLASSSILAGVLINWDVAFFPRNCLYGMLPMKDFQDH